MDLTAIGMFLIIVILAIIISSLPLYFAVHMLGGDATILKVFLTNLLIGVLTGVFGAVLGVKAIGGILALVITTIIYMVMFHLGILRAIIAMFLSAIIAFLLTVLAAMVLGVTIPALTLL
jgi:hypothetical protein